MVLVRRKPQNAPEPNVFEEAGIDIEKIEEIEEEAHRTPVYDSQSHASVMFQIYGSVWPNVLPFCLLNVGVAGMVLFFKHVMDIDVTFPCQGHTIMSGVLSFLLVSRLNSIYSTFMAESEHLQDLYRSSKELVHYMAVLSGHDQGKKAKEWRQEVAYRTILLLRVTMAAVEHPSSKKNTWELPELDNAERQTVRKSLALTAPTDDEPVEKKKKPRRGRAPPDFVQGGGTKHQNTSSNATSNVIRWAHGPRTLRDENLRAPIFFVYKLRESIVSHKNKRLKERLHVNEEREMLVFVSQFMSAYHGIRKHIMTPYPFPLVQMARWFNFFWLFTMPFALAHEISTYQVLIIVFVITYGFLGLEEVSTELDDPFGDDPNDFNNLAMAQLIFEDIYITINNVDGSFYAQQLRDRIAANKKENTPMGHYRKESSSLYRDVSSFNVLMEWD